MSTFQFFLVGHIYFADLDGSDLVNNVCSTYRCNISRNCIFTYSINNCLSSCIFRKFCKLVSPIAICSYFLVAYFFSVCKESDCNTFRTFCNLITIVPGLSSFYADYLCFMSICKDKSFCRTSCYCYLIASRYLCFSYCVNNVLSIFLSIKLAPCVCPVIVFTQSYFFTLCCIACIKLYLD